MSTEPSAPPTRAAPLCAPPSDDEIVDSIIQASGVPRAMARAVLAGLRAGKVLLPDDVPAIAALKDLWAGAEAQLRQCGDIAAGEDAEVSAVDAVTALKSQTVAHQSLRQESEKWRAEFERHVRMLSECVRERDAARRDAEAAKARGADFEASWVAINERAGELEKRAELAEATTANVRRACAISESTVERLQEDVLKEREAHANCAVDYGVLAEALGGRAEDHAGNMAKVQALWVAVQAARRWLAALRTVPLTPQERATHESIIQQLDASLSKRPPASPEAKTWAKT